MIASLHAIERYVERVKPYLGNRQAREELEALVAVGSKGPCPDWYQPEQPHGDAVYVDIGPGAVAVTVNEAVLTVVIEPVDEVARAKRRKVKRLKRRAKRVKGRSNSNWNRAGRPHLEDAA